MGWAISPDDNRVVVAGGDHSLLLCDADTLDVVRALQEPKDPEFLAATAWASMGYNLNLDWSDFVKQCRFSPCGSMILSENNSSMRLWSAIDGTRLGEIRSASSPPVFSPDGMLILTASMNQLCLWKTSDLTCVKDIPIRADGCRFLPDGRKVIFFSEGNLQIYDIRMNAKVSSIERIHRYKSSYLLTAGKKVIFFETQGNLAVADLDSGKILTSFEGNSELYSIGMGNNGRKFAAGDGLGFVYLLEADNFGDAEAIVTAGYLYNYRKKSWEDPPAVNCVWCSVRFAVPPGILACIRQIYGSLGFSSDVSPCIYLPDEAWNDPGLLSECPSCHKKLRFNPFCFGSGPSLH